MEDVFLGFIARERIAEIALGLDEIAVLRHADHEAAERDVDDDEQSEQRPEQRHGPHEPEPFAGRPVHLCGTAQGIRVLHAAAVFVRLVDAAALQQHVDVRGRGTLPLVRPGVVNPRFEGMHRTAEPVDRQGGRDIGGPRDALGGDAGQRRDTGRRLRPVDQGEALLRFEHDRRQAHLPQGVRTADDSAAVDRGVPFADQHQRQMRQRREIPAGADGSAARHDRMDTPIQERDQRFERLAADSRKTFCQDVGA